MAAVVIRFPNAPHVAPVIELRTPSSLDQAARELRAEAVRANERGQMRKFWRLIDRAKTFEAEARRRR